MLQFVSKSYLFLKLNFSNQKITFLYKKGQIKVKLLVCVGWPLAGEMQPLIKVLIGQRLYNFKPRARAF